MLQLEFFSLLCVLHSHSVTESYLRHPYILSLCKIQHSHVNHRTRQDELCLILLQLHKFRNLLNALMIDFVKEILEFIARGVLTAIEKFLHSGIVRYTVADKYHVIDFPAL